jgi:hypothetical protein
MPNVGGRRFGYGAKGMKAAKDYAKKTGKKVVKKAGAKMAKKPKK